MAEPTALIVLADGIQSAFVAGATAELARSGARWEAGLGAGLGAQVAALALLGDAAEAERRWRRQAELGCPLLRPRVEALVRRLRPDGGFLVLPDAYALGGWLDPEELEEHLAPEAAGLPERLRAAGVRLWVAVEDLGSARRAWVEVSSGDSEQAERALRAAASFAAGWPPVTAASEPVGGGLWGGVSAVPAGPPDGARFSGLVMVCGFPLPAVARPVVSTGLLEAVQCREQIAAASTAGELASRLGPAGALTVAPSVQAYRSWAKRDGADLGVEYPLPWERNGELAAMLVEFGRHCARQALAARESRS